MCLKYKEKETEMTLTITFTTRPHIYADDGLIFDWFSNWTLMSSVDLHQWRPQSSISELWDQTSPAHHTSTAQHLERGESLTSYRRINRCSCWKYKIKPSRTFNWLPRCIRRAELLRLTDHQLWCSCGFKDAEIKVEETWGEAGGGGVHWGQQTIQCGFKFPLHAHEERDEVLHVLEAAGETHQN